MMRDHPILKCVERAVQFIQTELHNDRAPTLDDIATSSGLSKFHFHRVYKLVTGETCQQTVTRLRLAKGTWTLQDPGMSITDAAFTAGYGSSQAFAKAIKRELTETPSALRSDPERLADTVRTLLEPNQLDDGHELQPIRIEICSLDPFEVLLVRTTDKYPELAQTYWQLVEAIGEPQNIRAILGMPHRDIATFEDEGFVFDCALAPFTVPQKLPSKLQPALTLGSIASGPYLLARHTGPDSTLPTTLDDLYAFALARPDFSLADVPCIHHFIDDPEKIDEAKCRTDIYLKIEIAE